MLIMTVYDIRTIGLRSYIYLLMDLQKLNKLSQELKSYLKLNINDTKYNVVMLIITASTYICYKKTAK